MAHPNPTGDINKDCCVDYFDFAIIGDQWQQLPSIPSADIAPEGVGDGAVNLLDLAVPNRILTNENCVLILLKTI